MRNSNYGVIQIKFWDISFAESIAKRIILEDDMREYLLSFRESYMKIGLQI